MRIARLMNSLAKGPKRKVTKGQWPCWKVHDNWVAYFRIWSRRNLHRFCARAQTCRDQSNVWNSQWLLRVTLKIETKILRSDTFAQVNLISVSPTLQNLRIGLKRRQSGKSKVPAKQRGSWPKISSKLKEKQKTTFFSPLENRCLPASSLEPEEREFVVDSGASMHMISKKDLNSAEMDTLTKSRSPTIVITATGEVQTHEEATVYVKELEKSWLWKSSNTRQQYYRLESFAMKTDIHTSGSTVKNHVSLKTVFGYSVIRKTSFRSWFLVCQRVLPPVFPLQHPWHLSGRKRLPQGRLLHQPRHFQLCQVIVRLEHGKTWVG